MELKIFVTVSEILSLAPIISLCFDLIPSYIQEKLANTCRLLKLESMTVDKYTVVAVLVRSFVMVVTNQESKIITIIT